MTDYSRPPLTESADPYYSSGSSHSGYLDQVEDYHYNSAGGSSPQMPKPAYQQSQGSNVNGSSSQSGQNPLFVQRTNSSRMPKSEMHDGNNIYRTDSGRRVGGSSTPTRGLERNGSGSNASSSRTKVSPSPVQMHPTPIARSNSTRLPPSMRGGGGATQPSGLSQANNFDYM
ncbi:hypothetical protein BGX23_011475 [Mortierella sp. AD031]|nr:hypothetical protein BGX23_011475 [Mortierella sp. AD031]